MPAAKVDVPTIPADTNEGRWVVVPEKDIFDSDHPAIRINGINYGPGKYFLSNAVADTVEERLKVYQKATARILQPKKDSDAENLVNKGLGQATTSF